jgi:hypothetical protein
LNFLIKYWPVYLVAYLGMAFWFYAAPNFRFGYSYIMTSSLLVVLPWLMLLHNNLSINEKGLVSALLVLFISFQALTLVESIDWNTLASRQILPADYKSLPTAPCQLANTTVFQPDKDSWSECWYRAFPCTYQCDPHVALRGTTLQEGFRYLP